MASAGPYADPEEKPGGASQMFVNQNGGTPPQQQQQQQPQPQHIPSDELQIREQLSQHMQQQGADMMHQQSHLHQQMNAISAAHHHFQTPPRPVHSPQHMAQSAQSVMGIDDHTTFIDHDGASRKRSKVSRACDECRRKKVRLPTTSWSLSWLTSCRFDAMRRAKTVRNHVRVASVQVRGVSSADSR